MFHWEVFSPNIVVLGVVFPAPSAFYRSHHDED